MAEGAGSDMSDKKSKKTDAATNEAKSSPQANADGIGTPSDSDRTEYEAAVHDLIENKERLLHEMRMLERQSKGEIEAVEEAPAHDSESVLERDIGDNGDSGHIADIISEDGEDVSGAIIWSSSGRKFVLMSTDGNPVSDLEAEQATELVNSNRIAFDGAREQEYFVSQMSSVGVDVDRDRIDLSSDGSTGELLVTPENLVGNERHHISGEHAGEGTQWTDEVDLSDPESTGPQRIKDIIEAQSHAENGAGPKTDAKSGKTPKKISGLHVYRMDNIMTFLAVFIIVGFYILVLAFQRPNPFLLGVWSVLCVACATSVLMPFTMSMETRERNIGGKFMLTGSLCVMFAIMSGFLLGDVLVNGRRPWSDDEAPSQEEPVDDKYDPDSFVSLNFEPSGDIVTLEMTGSQQAYSAVSIGNVLVTTSEASKASSLVANIGGKRYATQVVATIDGLGISAFAVEGTTLSNPIKLAKSLSIGQDAIVYSTGADGAVRVEGTTIRSTTFPVGTHGLPESSEVDQVFVNKSLAAGDIVMDAQGRLIGIAAESGDGVVTGTSISKAVNVLTSDDNEIYIGIVCRQASISENKDGGAYVENVMTNSPASNAGIMTGDVIVSVDGEDVTGTDDLDSIVGEHEAGEQISLGIIRNGTPTDLSVTIGRHSQDGKNADDAEESRRKDGDYSSKKNDLDDK